MPESFDEFIDKATGMTKQERKKAFDKKMEEYKRRWNDNTDSKEETNQEEKPGIKDPWGEGTTQ